MDVSSLDLFRAASSAWWAVPFARLFLGQASTPQVQIGARPPKVGKDFCQAFSV
jgi:hypothetical protein